jgi:Protein of unknown function (DUF1566)
MAAYSRADELAKELPAAWRADFVRFVETGEADKALLDFLASDRDAQSAVEAVFKQYAAALQDLAALLRSAKTGTPKIGGKMLDDTVYAGSLEGKDIYTTPADAPLSYTFSGAAKYAKKLNREKYLGHDDWRVPTKAELNVLFNNRAAIGGFGLITKDNQHTGGWYWSSSSFFNLASRQRFNDGKRDFEFKIARAGLRCVR